MYSISKSLSLIINKQQKCTIILMGINFIGQSWALNKQYVIEFQQARAINFLLSFKKVFFSSLWVRVQHSALVGRVRGQWAIFSSSKVSFQKFSIEVVVDRHLVKNMLSSLNSIKILVFGQVSIWALDDFFEVFTTIVILVATVHTSMTSFLDQLAALFLSIM